MDPDGVLEMNLKTGEVTVTKPDTPAKEPTAKPGEVKVGEMELICKAGPDGKSLGDCPFTQFVNMVMQYKKLPFKLTPCAPDSKPDWLVENYEGKMPCLVHDGEAYTESSEIVRYLEYFFPQPALTDPSDPKASEKATEVCSGVFPALAKCLKNLDKTKDPDLVNALLTELGRVDAWLKNVQSRGGTFLCGEKLMLPDCSFAPKLYHVQTGLAQFKNTVVPPELEALHKYMDAVFATEAFQASAYPPDVVVWGWNNARGTQAK